MLGKPFLHFSKARGLHNIYEDHTRRKASEIFQHDIGRYFFAKKITEGGDELIFRSYLPFKGHMKCDVRWRIERRLTLILCLEIVFDLQGLFKVWGRRNTGDEIAFRV